MEKLILEKNPEDYYILEVNDKGETIEFDLTDITLPEKFINAGNQIERFGKIYADKEKQILEEYKDDEEKLYKEYTKLIIERGEKYREIFDDFLGKGACYKIFGDKESIGQYNKLIDALKPHIEKMKIKKEKAQQRLVDKYLNKKSDVI